MSGRETEVLGLLGEHLSHAEIAARLFISVRTVESHVASLRRKLCVGTHRELVRLAAGYRAAGTGPGLAAPPALPTPLTSFVGRDGERAALAAALGTSRLVSAVGPGGIGKTRLALAVAADVAARFGVTWYADLVPVTDPALLPAAVLAALGADESSSRPAQDALAAAVGERRALLVLDNCEHLVNAVAVLTERLLSACPNLSVLVTSRIRLVVPHETVYPVPGLSVPPPGREGGDAATLFAERAAAAGAPLPAGPAGTDDAAGSAAHRAAGICRALGGMPLAIELAAARLPSLGLDDLEAGLADQLSLLSGGARQQQRHRSLQDTLDWSYRLLDPREQAVLRRVAVFAAPFGLAAATVVVGYDPVELARVADALGRLAEHSLLVPVASAGGTRYHALEPVRQFAAARLDAEAEGDGGAYRRHLGWCLTEATGLDRADPAEPEWQAAFDAAADEFRAALGWSAALPPSRPMPGGWRRRSPGCCSPAAGSARHSSATSRPRRWPATRRPRPGRWNARPRPPRSGPRATRRCGWTGRRPPRTCEPVTPRPPRSRSPAAPSTSAGSPACTPGCPPRVPRAGCWPTRGPGPATTRVRPPRSPPPGPRIPA